MYVNNSSTARFLRLSMAIANRDKFGVSFKLALASTLLSSNSTVAALRLNVKDDYIQVQ
jgi:hypothetical protein